MQIFFCKFDCLKNKWWWWRWQTAEDTISSVSVSYNLHHSRDTDQGKASFVSLGSENNSERRGKGQELGQLLFRILPKQKTPWRLVWVNYMKPALTSRLKFNSTLPPPLLRLAWEQLLVIWIYFIILVAGPAVQHDLYISLSLDISLSPAVNSLLLLLNACWECGDVLLLLTTWGGKTSKILTSDD